MNRTRQIVLILATVVGSWLGMQAVHELGHMLAAWSSGGRVTNVALHPLAISRTDVEGGIPLLVVWSGPVFGVVAPLILWLAARAIRMPGTFVARFFAGFCLIANGAYIGGGSFEGIGDCGELLRNGAAIWHLWLFGLIAIPSGLALWHGLGKSFGLGREPESLRNDVVVGTVLAVIGLLVIGLWIGH